MSCYDELTLSIYADGELPPNEALALRAHLADCSACRNATRALETEAQALRATFQEAALQPAPRLGLTWWLGVLAAALAGATLSLDWLSTPQLPMELAWLNPLDLYFALSVLGHAALHLVEEGVPTMSPTIAMLMVLGFCAWRYRRGTAPLAALAAGLALFCATPAQATEGRFPEKGSQVVVIGAQETIDDTVFAAGDTVIVEGTVKGDLIAVGRAVRVKGTVTGSVLCLARDLEVEGQIDGDVYALNETLLVRGRVGRNVHSLTKRTQLDSSGSVMRDVLVAAEEMRLTGAVGRNARFFGKLAELSGRVGGKAQAHAERVHVLDSAEVAGDLVAYVPTRANAEISAQAKVLGATRVSEDEAEGKWKAHGPRHEINRFTQPRFYLWQVLWLTAALVTGALMFLLSPLSFAPRAQSTLAALKSIGIGFLVLVVTPIAALVLCATIVGLPVALVALGGWVAALYLAGIFAAAWLGQLVLRRATLDLRSFLLALLVGEVILRVVSHLPYVGGTVCFLALLLGLGLGLAATRALVVRVRAA